jgi:hypothetical protein
LVPVKLNIANEVVRGVSCSVGHTVFWTGFQFKKYIHIEKSLKTLRKKKFTEIGNAYSCGASSRFRLGFTSEDDVFVPAKIEKLSKVTFVASGLYHNCALLG